MKHIQTETEKNISIMPQQVEDDLNSKEQPKKIKAAVYCRVGTRKQLQDGSDETNEITQRLSMDSR